MVTKHLVFLCFYLSDSTKLEVFLQSVLGSKWESGSSAEKQKENVNESGDANLKFPVPLDENQK